VTAGTFPQHRDMGSLLTLSVLLTPPSEFQGAEFLIRGLREEGGAAASAVGVGDALLFPSEKRHNVSELREGERRSFVIELWQGAANSRNRHA